MQAIFEGLFADRARLQGVDKGLACLAKEDLAETGRVRKTHSGNYNLQVMSEFVAPPFNLHAAVDVEDDDLETAAEATTLEAVASVAADVEVEGDGFDGS